jgi:hypothetical protein
MSHGYFGNNAVRCMKVLSSGYTTDQFMDILCERMGGAPRDNEDVMCDFVRFSGKTMYHGLMIPLIMFQVILLITLDGNQVGNKDKVDLQIVVYL